MPTTDTDTKPSSKLTARIGRGLGKDAPYYVVAAGVVADSLNKRYGLGLSPQELIALVAVFVMGAHRIMQYFKSFGD